MKGKEPWNKGKSYELGPYSEERKENLKKPHTTKQREMLKNLKIINKILEMRSLGFSYNKITQETGINYHLLKSII